MSRPVHWLPTEDAARTACGWAVTPRMSAVHHRHDWVTCERCHPAAEAAAWQAARAAVGALERRLLARGEAADPPARQSAAQGAAPPAEGEA